MSAGTVPGSETERLHAELLVAKQQLWLLRDLVPYVVYVYDITSRRLRFLNRHLATVLGFDEQQAQSMDVDSLEALLHPNDRRRLPELWRRWREVSGGDVIETEYRIRHTDGTWRWFYSRAVGLERDDSGQWGQILVASAEVTHHKRLGDEAQAAQEMEVVGRLAGGVAHEFNNLLTVILGDISLALGSSPDAATMLSLLHEVEGVAGRAARLTRQLLAFASKDVVRLETFNPDDALKSIRPSVQRLIHEAVQLDFVLAAANTRLLMDRSQFIQVVENLVVNASEAMPAGGRLVVRTERRTVEPPETARLRLDAGSFFQIVVSDTGESIPSDTVTHIFEPFFIRQDGRSAGLGLSTVYGIVKQAHGTVHVNTHVTGGSEFVVLLPEHMAMAAPDPSPLPSTAADPRRVKVLIVEDDPLVAKVAVSVLRRSGYHVLLATDGEEGLAAYERHADEIGVILSDVVMPRLSGVEMAIAIRQRCPSLPIVLMSGYAKDELRTPNALADADFIAKPFSADDLISRISRLLVR